MIIVYLLIENRIVFFIVVFCFVMYLLNMEIIIVEINIEGKIYVLFDNLVRDICFGLNEV